jgi:hypothetical protein
MIYCDSGTDSGKVLFPDLNPEPNPEPNQDQIKQFFKPKNRTKSCLFTVTVDVEALFSDSVI